MAPPTAENRAVDKVERGKGNLLTEPAALLRAQSIASGRTPMPYTLAQAAQATGMNRSTILRAIKSGRITGTRDDGAWHVEPAELFRAFASAEATPKAMQQDATADALVALLREQLADMRTQRDAWQKMAEARLLPAPEQKPMSWWKWLRTAK